MKIPKYHPKIPRQLRKFESFISKTEFEKTMKSIEENPDKKIIVVWEDTDGRIWLDRDHEISLEEEKALITPYTHVVFLHPHKSMMHATGRG
mgnify:CR=1 FL=1